MAWKAGQRESHMQVRCLIDVPGEKLPSSLAEHLAGHVAPQVPEALRAAFLEAVVGGRICSMQNKLMPAAPLHRPGALLLGDAFNMRHPLTGVLLRCLVPADHESDAMGLVLGSNCPWRWGPSLRLCRERK